MSFLELVLIFSLNCDKNTRSRNREKHSSRLVFHYTLFCAHRLLARFLTEQTTVKFFLMQLNYNIKLTAASLTVPAPVMHLHPMGSVVSGACLAQVRRCLKVVLWHCVFLEQQISFFLTFTLPLSCINYDNTFFDKLTTVTCSLQPFLYWKY